jgi:hypothetical protein
VACRAHYITSHLIWYIYWEGHKYWKLEFGSLPRGHPSLRHCLKNNWGNHLMKAEL